MTADENYPSPRTTWRKACASLHVRDTVVKPHGDERRNWQEDSRKLPGRVACAHRHPDCNEKIMDSWSEGA